MIQDKTMNILAKERTTLLVMIDQETDETKKMQLEEQLQALTESMERRKQELLGTKETKDYVEIKVEEELNKVSPETSTSLYKQYSDECNYYKDLMRQVTESRQRKKGFRELIRAKREIK